jgi:hypothetical protein
MDTLLQVVHEIDVSVIIAAEDVREFKGRTGVAAVEDNEQSTVGRHPGDKVFVEGVAVDLAIFLEINWTDGIENT